MYLHTAFVRNEITFLQFEVDLKVIDTKGQLISKCLLGVIVSTKKPTKFL